MIKERREERGERREERWEMGDGWKMDREGDGEGNEKEMEKYILRMMKMEREIMLNMDMVNGKVEGDCKAEAVGYEGRAAHGSVVGATIRGWRMPGVIEAGWKVAEILLSQQNLPTLGTPEEPSSLRLKYSRSAASALNYSGSLHPEAIPE